MAPRLHRLSRTILSKAKDNNGVCETTMYFCASIYARVSDTHNACLSTYHGEIFKSEIGASKNACTKSAAVILLCCQSSQGTSLACDTRMVQWGGWQKDIDCLGTEAPGWCADTNTFFSCESECVCKVCYWDSLVLPSKPGKFFSAGYSHGTLRVVEERFRFSWHRSSWLVCTHKHPFFFS